jgi:hypothetical protein
MIIDAGRNEVEIPFSAGLEQSGNPIFSGNAKFWIKKQGLPHFNQHPETSPAAGYLFITAPQHVES